MGRALRCLRDTGHNPGKLSKEARAYIAYKIRKIRKEEPNKPMRAVIGKAFGMAKQKGFRGIK